MELTSAQLWERIHRSGLATPELCRSWALEIAQAGNAEALHDVSKLAGQLIRSGRLTPFQLNALMEPTPPKLSVGPYQIVDTLSDQLGPCWFESRDAIRAQAKWCFQWTASDLLQPQAKQWPPSIEMAKLHCRLEHSSLDRWEAVIAEPGMLACFCDPLSGQSLASVLENGPLTLEQSIQMVQQIGSGLTSLHESELFHGLVSVDTIWVDANGDYRLRRDPLFPPKSPYAQPPSACLPVDGKNILSTAAPEWAMPGCAPSEQIDLYALGVVWAHALMGKIPWPNATRLDTTGWKKTHQQTPISLDPSLPEPIAQCIRYLVAKNPAARFSNAPALLRALEQASAPKSTVANMGGQQTDSSVAEESVKVSSETKEPVAQSRTASVKPQIPSDATKSTAKVAGQPTAVLPAAPGNTSDKKQTTAKPESTPQSIPSTVAEKKTPTSDASSSPSSAANVPSAEKKRPEEKTTAKPALPAAANPIAEKTRDTKPAPTTSPATEPSTGKIAGTPTPTAKEPAPKQPTLAATTAPANEPANSLPKEDVSRSETSPVEASGSSPSPQATSKVASKAPTAVKAGKGAAGKGTEAKGAKTGKGKKKKKKPAWLLPALAVGSTLFVGLLLAVLLQTGEEPVKTASGEGGDKSASGASSNATSSSSASNATETKKPVAPVDPLAEYFQVKADDGQLLWAPPSAGSPQSLEMLPPGAEAIVFFSPATWDGTSPSEKLQSWWLSNIPGWSSWIGKYPLLKTKDLQQVTLALYPSKTTGVPDVVLRLTLKEAVAIDSFVETLEDYLPKDVAPTSDTKRQIWAANGIAVAFDELSANPKQTTRRVVIGPTKVVESLADTLGGAVPLRRQMDALLQVSDSRSDMYAIAAPSFLFGDAREIFASTPLAMATLKELVDDTVQAISFSAHWQPKLYMEYRMVTTDTKNAGKMANELKQKLEKVPDTLESTFVTAPPPAYWRALAARYPQMLRSVAKNTRFGVEEGQVAANVYLPTESLSNLTIATWMSLQPASASGATGTIAKTPNVAPGKMNVEQMLDAPMNISFEQESLEMGLAAIGAEFNDSVVKGGKPIRLTINGSAFQKEGITQNQQIRAFAQKGVPLRTVLTDLVRRANPVTTVKSPTEKDQKVVWVILDDDENAGEKKVELTTRTWAEANKASLPKEFVP